MQDERSDILVRLRRIEGQVKGIQKMIESGQCCSDILIQIAAVRSAINKVGGLILEDYSKVCISECDDANDREKNMDKLIDTILKFIK